MTINRRITLGACVLFGLTVVALGVFTWRFHDSVRRFEGFVGEKELCAVVSEDNSYRFGNHIWVKPGGPRWLKNCGGVYLHGTFGDVHGVGLSEISARSIKALSVFPQIRVLYLEGPGGTAGTALSYPELAYLEELALSATGLDDESAIRLTQAGRLRSLSLFSEEAISDSGLANVLSVNPHVESLSVVGSTQVKGRFWVDHLDSIHFIALEGLQFDDSVVRELASVSTLKSLLLMNTRVGDLGIRELCRSEIEILSITDSAITDQALEFLVDAKQITRIIIRSGLSAEAVTAFRRARPDCELIYGD